MESSTEICPLYTTETFQFFVYSLASGVLQLECLRRLLKSLLLREEDI